LLFSREQDRNRNGRINRMSTDTLINLLNLAALIIMMMYMGLSVSFGEIVASAKRIRLVASGLLANFVVVPVVIIGLLLLFKAQPMASAGFLILAVCPGAPLGPPLVALAKGDVAFSVGFMVILALLTAIVSPFLLTFLLSYLPSDAALTIDYVKIIKVLVVGQIAPLLAGIAIHQWLERIGSRLVKPFKALSNILLAGVIVLILATQYTTLAAIRARGFFGMLLLFLASMLVGWFAGGRGREMRRAMALTTTVRNVAVALVIVTGNFPGTPAVTAVIAYALVSIVGSYMVAIIMGKRGGAKT
jgi:bile acid:Na+ symporter, BASS family